MNSFFDRRGRFYISEKTMTECLDTVSETLADIKFVPTSVSFLWDEKRFDMCGMSPLFDELSEGAPPPEYAFKIAYPTPENGFRFNAAVVKVAKVDS